MFRRFSLIFLSLLIGITAYVVYAAVLVPGFVIPRTLRVHRFQAPGADGAMSALRLMSQQNDLLISPLFPDPNDWRRKEPRCMMVTVEDQKWLLLIQNESERLEGSSEFSAEACTVVIPSSDAELSQEERYRRAIVLETNDKVVFRLKQEISFQTLNNLQLDMLTEGRLTGEVKIWSKMDPGDPADDFSVTTRDMSFNAEQIVTDSDVIFHYGSTRVEGQGLHVRIDLPEQKEGEPEDEAGLPKSLADRLRAGNLGGGFSIRDIRLAKLNLLEFEVPDFLPNLPEQDGWEEMEETESDEEKMMKMDVRCGGDLFFAPNMTDAPAVWCARFSNNVEITALHEEREQDTLRCDYLYLYLIDPELKQDWDQNGDSWKRKRKPSGNIARLAPYQVRAIGSEERKSVLQIADSFFRAESGEILCEIDQQRLSLHPLPDTAGEEYGTAEKTSDEKDGAFLQYGSTSVVSDRIEFTYNPNTYGSLKAYRKGKLTSEIPESDGAVSHVSAVWSGGVQIVPSPEYGEGIYTASFRGSVGFNWDRIGNLTADAADFWFTVLRNGKPEQTMVRPAGGSSEKEDGNLSVRPKSARLSGQVAMKMERGTCHIQDCVEILFTEAAKIPGRQDLSAPSGKAENPASEIFSGKGNSLMGGGENGDSLFSISGGRLKLWTVMTGDGGIDVSRITLQDQIRILETDHSGQNEKLRIDGNVVSVENPGSERAALVLRGKPAEFSGYGLNLSGYDIKVDRAKNMFSVNGSGRLQITPRADDSNAALSASASPFDAVKTEPVEVWWPKGMIFDGKSLVFQGLDSESGGSAVQDSSLVRVVQGRSLELKSQLISLILKRPVQIFEFDMNRNGQGDMNGIELDQAVCQGSLQVPVSVAWYGAVPQSGGNAEQNQNGLRGKGKGEVSHLTLTMATGNFSASGPGWIRGTVETPPEMMKQLSGSGGGNGDDPKNPLSISPSKPWTHFHIRFHDMMTGNINDHNLKVNGDVRSVVGTSDSPDMELDANERKTFPEDAFFLTCNELGGAGTLSPVSGGRNFEVSAFGETRFTYQNVTGLGKVLKYDHLKRNVILQGDGVTSASLNMQERPGAPVNTQSFNSASFNLETKKLDMSISGINFSNEK